MTRYTLDRIDDGFYVFLKYDNEQEELLIPATAVSVQLNAGDHVDIRKDGEAFTIHFLQEETREMKSKVNDLLNKLKQKK